MPAVLCHTCRAPIPPHDMIHYGSIETGYRDLCSRCFNEEVAREGGLNFEHVRFDPVEMIDVAGVRHQFHFRLHLLGDRVSMESFELQGVEPSGYQFAVIGEPEVDLFALMAQLVTRMRRALSVRHLKDEGDGFGLGIADFLVKGHIAWDDEHDGRLPLLVIDGQEVPWDTFGRMLMTFEGWQFKLEIRDRSEEI